MKLKVKDIVIIIAGKDKGKTGHIMRTISKHNRIVVEGVAIRTKHIKKTQQKAGEKIKFEAPISASNAMILDPVQNKPSRIGYKMLSNGKKERISKLSGASLDNISASAAAAAPKTAKKKTAAASTTNPDAAETAPTKPSKSKKTVVKA
jgi:large subunit ribosomal protein L24